MLLDAHTHIDMYDDDILPVVLDNIARQQIFTLSVSIDVPSYQRAQRLATQSPYLVPTFGVHPWQAHHYADKLDSLAAYMAQTPLFGEIGLDFHFFKEPAHQIQQRAVFEFFLDAATRQQKIVNLHTLRAEKEVLAQLEVFRPPTPIVHWYAGRRSLIERYLAVGAYFSFGVELLFSKRLEKLLTDVPNDRLLTETDNPSAYRHFTKQSGMPSTVCQVVAKIAELKQMADVEVIEMVAENFSRLIAPVTAVSYKWHQLRIDADKAIS